MTFYDLGLDHVLIINLYNKLSELIIKLQQPRTLVTLVMESLSIAL